MSNKVLLSLAVLFTLMTSAVVMQRVYLAALLPKATCQERVQTELNTILDEYRARIFGSTQTFDGRGYAPRTGGETKEKITGILETKGRLTSELVSPLIESYRVLRCKAESVCAVVDQSFQTFGGSIELSNLGCPTITTNRYTQCFFAGEKIEDRATSETTLSMQRECNEAVAKTLEVERDVLKLAVAYDAGHRSILQFSGMTDWMMKGMTSQALETTRGTVNMLGKLHQIPCFIGQCDMPETNDLTP